MVSPGGRYGKGGNMKKILFMILSIFVVYLLNEYKHWENRCDNQTTPPFCYSYGHIQWKLGEYGLMIKVSRNVRLE